MREESSVLSCPASNWGHVRKRKGRGRPHAAVVCKAPIYQWSSTPKRERKLVLHLQIRAQCNKRITRKFLGTIVYNFEDIFFRVLGGDPQKVKFQVWHSIMVGQAETKKRCPYFHPFSLPSSSILHTQLGQQSTQQQNSLTHSLCFHQQSVKRLRFSQLYKNICMKLTQIFLFGLSCPKLVLQVVILSQMSAPPQSHQSLCRNARNSGAVVARAVWPPTTCSVI